jgi:hypothetical protein
MGMRWFGLAWAWGVLLPPGSRVLKGRTTAAPVNFDSFAPFLLSPLRNSRSVRCRSRSSSNSSSSSNINSSNSSQEPTGKRPESQRVREATTALQGKQPPQAQQASQYCSVPSYLLPRYIQRMWYILFCTVSRPGRLAMAWFGGSGIDRHRQEQQERGKTGGRSSNQFHLERFLFSRWLAGKG